MPTTSIFSRTDGICAWQAYLNAEGPLIENIEIDGSHCGLGHHPAVVYAIADRLAQPEGAWQKFDRGGWRALVFSRLAACLGPRSDPGAPLRARVDQDDRCGTRRQCRTLPYNARRSACFATPLLSLSALLRQ